LCFVGVAARPQSQLEPNGAKLWNAGRTGGLEKTKSLVRYLTENSTKSLCQLQDSDDFCFLDLLDFWPFCASFSDNLVTLASFNRFGI
jgi:hypothetical protein